MTIATAIPQSGCTSSGGSELGLSIRPSWMSADETGQRRRPGQLLSMEQARQIRSRPLALVFGRFRFVVHSREFTADGVPVPIGSRALEVLSVLIEARGELVTKDELLD